MHHALDFTIAPNQGVDLALARHGIEVLGELVKWAFFTAGRRLFSLLARIGCFCWLNLILTNAVTNKVNYIQASNALLLQEIHRVRILLTKNGDEDISAGHFFLAIGSRLHVHDRALDHPLKSQRRLRIHFFGAGYNRGVVINKVFKLSTQFSNVD